MGTSHHEPMLRAQQEWKRHGKGPWNYATNADVLREFLADPFVIPRGTAVDFDHVRQFREAPE